VAQGGGQVARRRALAAVRPGTARIGARPEKGGRSSLRVARRPAWPLRRLNEGARAGDEPIRVANHDSTPPVLRFALAVLDATSTDEIARVCAAELVAGFGVLRAIVRDEDGVRETAGAPANGDLRTTTIALRLSGPDESAVRIDIEIEPTPDLAIVRQQFLDLVGVARRAWARQRQLDRERTAARRDALTGLDNRRGMTEAIDVAWQDARHGGRPMTVMVVDLDRFKQVNDTLGHDAGDDVLQLAGTCLAAHLRPTDRVCRWGGDEFLILLPGVNATVAVAIAERLRTAFAADARARGTTMTIGIADTSALAPDELSATRLVAIADEALLEAKRSGRDRAAVARSFERAG
jgi:diguanylate cyclase (GGDEF)-like protein